MSLAQKHPPRPPYSTPLNQRQKSTLPKAQKQQRKRNTTTTQKRKPALPQRIPTPALSGEVDDDICPVCDSDCTCALEPATRPRTRATLLIPSKAPRKIPPQTSLHLSDSSSTSDEGETETDSEPTLPFRRRSVSEETASISSNAGSVKIPRANVLMSSSGSSSESDAEYEENKRAPHAPVGRKGKRIGKGPASGALTPLKAGKGVGNRVGKGKGKFVPQPTEDDESNNDASEYGTADDDADNMAYRSIEESVATEYFQKKSPRKLFRKDTNSGKGKGKKVPKSRKSKSKNIPLESYRSQIADVEGAGDNYGRCSRLSPKHLFNISEGEEDITLESMPAEVPPSLVLYSPGEIEDEIPSLPENHDYTELDKCDISEDEAEIQSPMSFFGSDTSSLSSPPPSAIDDTSSSNEADLEGNLSTSSISSSISLSSSDGDKTDTDVDSDISLPEPRPQNYMFASSPDTTEEDLRILAEEECFIIEEEEEQIQNPSSWSDDDEDEDEDDAVDDDISLAEDMRNAMSALILDPTNSNNPGSSEIATQMKAIHSQSGCSSDATQREASFTHDLNSMHMHSLPKLPGNHPRSSNLIQTTASAPPSTPNSPPSLSKPRLNFPVHRCSMSSSATASPEAIAAALAAAATAAKAVAAASSKYPSPTIGPRTLKCTVPGCNKVDPSRSLPMAATPTTSVKSPPVRTPLHGPPLKIALSDSTNGDVGPLRASECGLPMEHNMWPGRKPILPGLSDTCPPPASKRRRLSSGTSATAEVPPPVPAATPLIHSAIPLESAEENSTTPLWDVGAKSPPTLQSECNSPPSTIPSINIIPSIELDEVVHTEQFYSLDDCSENQYTDFLDLSSSQPLSPQQAAHVRALNRWERIPIGTFRRSRRLSAPYLPAAAITAAVKPGKEKDTVLWSAGASAISDDEADSTAHFTHHHRRRVHRHRLYESSDEDDVPSSFDPSLHRSFHPRVRNSKRIRYRSRNRKPDMFSGTLLDHEDAIAMMNGLGMDIGFGVGLGLDGLEEGMDMEIGMLLLQDCEEGEMKHDRNKQDDIHTHPYYDGETHAHEHTCEIYGYEPNEATFMTDGYANWTRSEGGRRRKGQQSYVPPLPFVPSHLLSTLSLPKTMTVPVPYGMDVEETKNVVGVGIGIGMKMSRFEDVDHHHPNVGILEDGYGSSGDETVSEPPSPKLRALQAAANTISSA